MKPKARVLSFTGPRSGLSNPVKAYSLIGVTVVAVVAFVVAGILGRPPETDANHCAVREIADSGAYFLIDLTDGNSLTSAQIEKVKADIDREAASLRDGDRLDIEILAAQSDGEIAVLQPLFAACRPRAPQNATLSQGKHVLEDQLQRDWTDRIAAVLDGLGKRRPVKASTTPLIDSIKAMRAGMRSRTKRFYLASDMLESSSALSMYRPIPPFEELRRRRLDIVLVDGLLADVDVQIHQAVSPINMPHQARAEAFWDRWLMASGGRVTFSRI